MGGGGWLAALRDQRAELRPLQDLRHQGPESEHHLGPARGRRWTELPQYVTLCVTMLPLSGHSKSMDMSVRGSYCGPGLNRPFCSTRPRQGRSSASQMESTS